MEQQTSRSSLDEQRVTRGMGWRQAWWPRVRDALIIGVVALASGCGAQTPVAAPTAILVASPASTIAPATVAAIQTQIAPTIEALATEVVATAGPPIATSVALVPVEITNVQVSPEDTTLTVIYSGPTGANLSGWLLWVGTSAIVLPNSDYLALGPNESVNLHSAAGTDSESDVYLGGTVALPTGELRAGTPILLVNPIGQVASLYRLP